MSVAFLGLDRNGNGSIDNGSELFGGATSLLNGTLATNGFQALAEYDRNADGRIDAQDPIYRSLRLWIDVNHNGVSEAGELRTLPVEGIVAIFTAYRDSRRVDRNGNQYRWVGRVLVLRNSHEHRRAIFDVIFVVAE